MNHVHVANSAWQRFCGLLGRNSLNDDEALMILPCNCVHMFFMKFPIDVVFCDKENTIVAVTKSLRPWRVSRFVPRSSYVIEFAAGVVSQKNLQVGDELRFLAG